MEIITNAVYGIKSNKSNKINVKLGMPYIKWSFLGFVCWGELGDSRISEWYFLGLRIK